MEADMGRRDRYFVGSLFSRQALYAYGIGSGITTTILLVTFALQGVRPQMRLIDWRPTFLAYLLEMYIRVSIPIWIPPVTWVEVVVVCANAFFGLVVLWYWSEKYYRSTF